MAGSGRLARDRLAALFSGDGPLVNAFLPEIAQARIGGFSATWLFLGVLFYPITWLLSS